MKLLLVAAHAPGPEEPAPAAPTRLVVPRVETVRADPHAWRVLVVDDEDDILVTIADLLPGFFQGALRIETASSAEQALERIQGGEAFDAVLSDHRMPGRQGLEFLGWLRENRPDWVRVLMTAYQERDLRQRAGAEASVHLFLAKPFDLADFADRLGQLLDARAAQASPSAGT